MKKSVFLGVLAGLAGSAVVAAMYRSAGLSDASIASSPALSDCDGTFDQLVIQYVPGAAATVGRTYCDFLRQLPAGVTVCVVCPDQAAFDDLRRLVGQTSCMLTPVFANHPMTAWSRDRWLAKSPAGLDMPICIVRPREEQLGESWPARKGDELISQDIAKASGGEVVERRSSLLFDGGDFVIDDKTAFVAPGVLARNFQHTVASEEELLKALKKLTGKKVVLLRAAPEHHAGMYMMAVGSNRVIVADPSAGRELFKRDLAAGRSAATPTSMPSFISAGTDFSPQTQAIYDSVAQQCRQAGYEVIRIPHVPGLASKAFITYTNVVIDNRDGKRVVYMPVYAGLASLNAAAEKVWREAGFDVRTVDCTDCCRYFGALRCLINVLSRK